MNCTRRHLFAIPAVLLFAVISTPASAAVIFNNGAPLVVPAIAQGALFADTGNANSSEVADDFTLLADLNVIRDIHWWGTYGGSPPANDAFTIKIYNDNAGTVGTLNTTASLSSLVRTATSTTINERVMYSYDAVVSDITLTAGTKYWLGISNTSGLGGLQAWAWVVSANSGSGRTFSTSNGTWTANNKSLAFNLTNTVVPEPATAVLAAISLLGLVAFKTVRRRNS